MHEGHELSTTPPVPPQRLPVHEDLPVESPAVASPPAAADSAPPQAEVPSQEEADSAQPESQPQLEVEPRAPVEVEGGGGSWHPPMIAPKRRPPTRLLVGAGAALAVLVAGVVVLKPGGKPDAAAIAAPSAAPASAASPAPVTPYDKAVKTLDDQAAALIRGDEAAWLAAVDNSRAGLRTRYRSIFRNLRGLGVTKVEYDPGVAQPVKDQPATVAFRTDLVYCFGDVMCPERPATEWATSPHISQKLTLRPVGGRYVITDLAASPEPDYHQPTPWESGDLVFAQGRRVTLAAASAQAKFLRSTLPVAERAAAVADHYAALNGTPQKRYRIFLAGEKQWKAWYGGDNDEWAIGLAVPLNRTGIDVLIRMNDMDDALTLSTTVQHELGHVVTLTGAFQMDAAEDTWLSEGIAEYIGWRPRTAAQSLRRYSVRWQLRRAAPKSMVPVRPGPKAPARAGDAFYGLSHLAVDCMAQKYGEAKLFAFVRLVLTEDNELDQAARDAYGVPFKTVDKACVPWIQQQAARY